ncbi:MAG: alcohol dehydrogenase catalytic domain-containing protein [Thermoanaerobaculia bacterium]
MRRVTIRDDGMPALESADPVTPRTGELLLRTRASGLCGTDLFKLAKGGLAPGTVLGHEVVGEVIAVGPGVESFRPGQRVVVPHHLACGRCRLCLAGAETQCPEFRTLQLRPGGFAEEIVVAAPAVRQSARIVPDALDDLDALFLEPAACVLRSIERAGLGAAGAAGSAASAAILGGGSMGLLHLLVLRAVRPGIAVTVIEPVAERRELARTLGAAGAFPSGGRALAGLDADAAFDCVGGGARSREALALVRPGGTVVLFAHGAPGEAPAFALNDLFQQEKRLVGAYSGALAEQRRIFDLLVAGALRPAILVSHRLPLEEFALGVELARRHEAMKVVFHP